MLDILKVINRAVGKSGGTFAQIDVDNGIVEANNGRISIRATVPELHGIDALVPAGKLISAVKACKGTPEIKQTKDNLIVKAGAFSARIPLGGGDFPNMRYDEGADVTVPANFVEKLAIAQSFAVSNDFNGILLRGSKIYGVSEGGAVALDGEVVDHDIVLPKETVADVISIKEQPTRMLISENYAVIEYASFALRTALVDKRWPDVDPFLTFDTGSLDPITDELRQAITTVLPFTDKSKRVTFTGEALTGGEAEVSGIILPISSFDGETLQTAIKVSDSIAITDTPHARFTGPGLTAVIAGTKVVQS